MSATLIRDDRDAPSLPACPQPPLRRVHERVHVLADRRGGCGGAARPVRSEVPPHARLGVHGRFGLHSHRRLTPTAPAPARHRASTALPLAAGGVPAQRVADAGRMERAARQAAQPLAAAPARSSREAATRHPGAAAKSPPRFNPPGRSRGGWCGGYRLGGPAANADTAAGVCVRSAGARSRTRCGGSARSITTSGGSAGCVRRSRSRRPRNGSGRLSTGPTPLAAGCGRAPRAASTAAAGSGARAGPCWRTGSPTGSSSGRSPPAWNSLSSPTVRGPAWTPTTGGR